jgi:hypothetical protein
MCGRRDGTTCLLYLEGGKFHVLKLESELRELCAGTEYLVIHYFKTAGVRPNQESFAVTKDPGTWLDRRDIRSTT